MSENTFIVLQEKAKVSSIEGRYLPPSTLENFLKELPTSMHLQTEGSSVCGKPIFSLTIGHGNCKLLLWSQMHGNESTTTKAVIDFLQFLAKNPNHEFARNIFSSCTLKIIPMLNPDGAERYTRINANKVDLNRDAKDQSQPENRVLQQVFTEFKPDYCFNLHDQRTIFGAGKQKKPATLSFLAPAFNAERAVNDARLTAMDLIAIMNKQLQEVLPGQVGRYDDAFNPNCVGDHFMGKKVPTVLFEAGHFPHDYKREKTRAYVFFALCTAIEAIMNNKFSPEQVIEKNYLAIPENEKNYYDFLFKEVKINHQITSVAVQFEERLVAKKVSFIPIIAYIGKIPGFYGHQEIDGKGKELRINNGDIPEKGTEIKKISLDNKIFQSF